MEDIGEKCGIFGIFDPGSEASRIVHPALWTLQHRGQESSGIASADGKKIYVHRGMGLVSHVYDEKVLKSLIGYIAIGHNRYSTSRGSIPEHSQPVITRDRLVAIAHNGNLPSTRNLIRFLKSKGITTVDHNDTELIHEAIKYFLVKEGSIEKAVEMCFPLMTGVFCLLILTKDKLVAIRDSKGIRPLSIGEFNSGWVVSSETCAFDTIGAHYIRDVRPGEMVVFDKAGIHSNQLTEGELKLDIFEFVYFARPDSILLGKCVNDVRRNLGRNLAHEYKIDADVVIPVPDSAIPAALGYSEISGIPFDHGFVKNRYIHRTFIRPTQKLRETDVSLKLNPLTQVISGKKVIIIDDSIVRGTTSAQIVEMVRNAGASQVHLLISSPPIRFPDFYGINTPRQTELIASRMSVSDIRKFVGADSLYYLSYPGLIQSTELPEYVFSTSCFTGIYPSDILERNREIDFDLRHILDPKLQTESTFSNGHLTHQENPIFEKAKTETILYTS